MSILQNMSIKHKLISIIMLACITGLVLAGAAFIGWQLSTFRNEMVRKLSTQAEMIAENCKAALAFQDAEDAKQTLQSLHVEPSIVFGCVYNKDNKLFATYYRDYAEIKVHPFGSHESGFSFAEGFLTVFKPIVLEGEKVGTVCLRSDMSPMYAMLKRNISIILAVLFLSSLAALLVSARLQKVISAPILSLAKSAIKIGKGDLTHRVQVQSKDELGYLAESFNEMAEHLEQTTTSIDNLNREINERVKAEKEIRSLKKQIEFILGATKTGINIIDSEFNIRYIDPEWQKVYGDPTGRKCYEYFMDRDDVCPGCGTVQAMETKEITVTEEFLPKENNRPIQVTTMPFQNEQGEWLVAEVNTDITERKHAEQALEKLNRELEATIQLLSRSNKNLQDFVYIASHDLREPLRKISSFGRLLESSLEGKLADDDRENIDFMVDGAERMTQMIEGLLTYSRLNTKDFEYQTVDVNKIIEQFRQLELATLLEETGATIEVPEPLPKVQADPVQIKQLLQNLIANGIKYCAKGIKPRIVIRAKKTTENKIRIEVQDNGIGIKKEYHDDIFTMFRRLHSREEYEGTGIGLSVCKKIVERHNGQIGVESEVGAGSTFWFTLPAAKEAAATSDTTALS